jgi:hypothetical protein
MVKRERKGGSEGGREEAGQKGEKVQWLGSSIDKL